MKKGKVVLIAAACILALYFMPFVTVNTSDSSGHAWRVPFGCRYASADAGSITFQGLRSAYALKKDAANALHASKEIKCYGKTYYYQEENDVSLSGFETRSGIPASVTFYFEKGNACRGWSGDDEVAWEIGALADADFGITPEEAAEKNWFVIVNGKALNPGIYNDFSRLVKQGVYSILRTMIVDGDEVKFVDIQLLENAVKQKAGENEQDAYYRVAVKTSEGIEEQYYTRYSETNETTPRIVSVYEKDAQGVEHETVLFTYSVQ